VTDIIIKRLKFETNCTSHASLAKFNEQYKNVVIRLINKYLEEKCSNLNITDSIIQKLEFQIDFSKDDVAQVLEKQLKDQLDKYVEESKLAERRISKNSSSESLIFYLEKGYLPWNAHSGGDSVNNLVLEVAQKKRLKKIIESVVESRTAVKRLIDAAPLNVLDEILESIVPKHSKNIRRWMEEFKAFWKIDSIKIELELWRNILYVIYLEKGNDTVIAGKSQFITLLLYSYAEVTHSDIKRLLTEVENNEKQTQKYKLQSSLYHKLAKAQGLLKSENVISSAEIFYAELFGDKQKEGQGIELFNRLKVSVLTLITNTEFIQVENDLRKLFNSIRVVYKSDYDNALLEAVLFYIETRKKQDVVNFEEIVGLFITRLSQKIFVSKTVLLNDFELHQPEYESLSGFDIKAVILAGILQIRDVESEKSTKRKIDFDLFGGRFLNFNNTVVKSHGFRSRSYLIDILEKLDFHEKVESGKQVYDQFSDEELLEALWIFYLSPTSEKQFYSMAQKISHDTYLFELLQHVPVALKGRFVLSFFNISGETDVYGGADVHLLFYDISRIVFSEIDSKAAFSLHKIYKSVNEKQKEVSLKIGELRAKRLIELLHIAATQSGKEVLKYLRSSSPPLETIDSEEPDSEPHVSSEELQLIEDLISKEKDTKTYGALDMLIYFLKFGYFPEAWAGRDMISLQNEIMEQIKSHRLLNSQVLNILQNKGARLRFFNIDNEDFQEFVLKWIFESKYKFYISKSVLLIKDLKKSIEISDFSIVKTLVLEFLFSMMSKDIEPNWVDVLTLLEEVVSERSDFDQDNTKEQIIKFIGKHIVSEDSHSHYLYKKSQLLEFLIQFLLEKLPTQVSQKIAGEFHSSFQSQKYSDAFLDEIISWILQKMMIHSDYNLNEVKIQIEKFSEDYYDEELKAKVRESIERMPEKSIRLKSKSWYYLQKLYLGENAVGGLFERIVITFLIRNFDKDETLLHKMVEIAREEYALKKVIPEFTRVEAIRQTDASEDATIRNWFRFFYELKEVIVHIEKEEQVYIRSDQFVKEIRSVLQYQEFNISVSKIFRSFFKVLTFYIPAKKIEEVVKQHDLEIVKLLYEQYIDSLEAAIYQAISLQGVLDDFRTGFESGSFSVIVKSVELKKQMLQVLSKKEPAVQLVFLQYLIEGTEEKTMLQEVIQQVSQYDFVKYHRIKQDLDDQIAKQIAQIEKESISKEYSTILALIFLNVEPLKKEQKHLVEKIKETHPQQIDQVLIEFIKSLSDSKKKEKSTERFWMEQFALFIKIVAEEVVIGKTIIEKVVTTSQLFHSVAFMVIDRLSKPELKKIGLKLVNTELQVLGKQLLRIAEKSDAPIHQIPVEFIEKHKAQWRLKFLVQTTLKELIQILDKAHHDQIQKELEKYIEVHEFADNQEEVLSRFYKSVLQFVEFLGSNYKMKLSTYATSAPILNTLVTQFSQKADDKTYSDISNSVADFFFTNYSLQGKEQVEEIFKIDLHEKAFDFAIHFLMQVKSEVQLLEGFSPEVSEVNVILEKTLISLKKEQGLSLHNVRSYLARNFKLFASGHDKQLIRVVEKFEEATDVKLPYVRFLVEFVIHESKSINEKEFYAQFSNLILKSENEFKVSIQITPQLTNYEQALIDEIRVLGESRRSIEEMRFINALQSSIISRDSELFVTLFADLEMQLSPDLKQFIYDEQNLITNYIKAITSESVVASQAIQFTDVVVIQEFVSVQTKLSKREVTSLSIQARSIEGYVISTVEFVASKRDLTIPGMLEELYSFARLKKNERVAQVAFKLFEDSQKKSFEEVSKRLFEQQKEDLSQLMKSSDIDQLKSDLIQRKYDWAEEIEEGEWLYIENAGLIIFTQFVEAFFNNLGYLNEEREFISYKEQERAVCILQYLATGKEEFHEHLLVLNKIICGMDITNPLLTKVIPNTKEKEEVNKLFNAVISNWPVVTKSSQDAIRETFINREGVVYLKDRDWNLKVEHLAVDRLMSKIPWGFGTIKLPWNKYIIFTEWI
jgi:hypothetical protein